MRRLLLAPVAVLALLPAACGGDDGGGGAATALKAGDTISMKSLRFRPDKVQVPVGQKVTWRNDDGVPHNVVAQSGAEFESKTFGKDGTYTFTPTKAGTVKYECTLHPGMTGQIVVVAK